MDGLKNDARQYVKCATEVLVNRIRNDVIPLFAKLIAGEKTYFENPYIEHAEDWQTGTPRHCSTNAEGHERCWQSVGEYRRQPNADAVCFPHDCKECPVYRGVCPTVVEELGEAFNNMVYLLLRKDETVQNAMNFTRDLAMSRESMDLENNLIREKMHTDVLTGLSNRRYLDDCLYREVECCQNRRHKLSVLMIDIDYFNSYNAKNNGRNRIVVHQAVPVCWQAVEKLILVHGPSCRWQDGPLTYILAS
ncbi:diguanylate cyclase [bacterium]|nr:diguanylate cyclase [bacterium]